MTRTIKIIFYTELRHIFCDLFNLKWLVVGLFQLDFKYCNKHTSDICDPSTNLLKKTKRIKEFNAGQNKSSTSTDYIILV